MPQPESVRLRLSAHIAEHGTSSVTLPWTTPGGRPVTAELPFTTRGGGALGPECVQPAVAAGAAGQLVSRMSGRTDPTAASASASLAQGVDVRIVAEHMGHANASTTLSTYAHLMPDAADRPRRAMDAYFRGEASEASARDVLSGGAGSASTLVSSPPHHSTID